MKEQNKERTKEKSSVQEKKNIFVTVRVFRR